MLKARRGTVQPGSSLSKAKPSQPARHGGAGFVDLVAGLKNDHLHSYVLSLPVSTEIAKVRGKDGYGFPKWVTDLDVAIGADEVRARVANDAGGTDLSLVAATPAQTARPNSEHVSSLTSYTTIDGAWHSTLSQTNVLASGTSRMPRGLTLTLGEGRLSDDLRSLRRLPHQHPRANIIKSHADEVFEAGI